MYCVVSELVYTPGDNGVEILNQTELRLNTEHWVSDNKILDNNILIKYINIFGINFCIFSKLGSDELNVEEVLQLIVS